MTETYSKGESGFVKETITITPTNQGQHVMINFDQSVNDTTIAHHTSYVPIAKFRELVKDVICEG
jgi:hypothetical protein